MNYEEARQIGPTGPAPGKWNWTNQYDGVTSTAWPCAYPDFEWPAWTPGQEPVQPTGRSRCDHETREEAERHHWKALLARVRLERTDLTTARTRERCDVPDCEGWEDFHTIWKGGFLRDALCEAHATFEQVVALHPFVSGTRLIHS